MSVKGSINAFKYLCFRFAKLEDCPIISLHMSITELEVKDQHQQSFKEDRQQTVVDRNIFIYMFELLGCEITRNARGISSCTRAERERRLDSKEPLSGLTLAHPFPRDSRCSQTENYMESLRAVRPPTSSLEMLLFMPYGFAPRLISLDTNFD